MSELDSSNQPAGDSIRSEPSPEGNPQQKLHQLLAGIWARSKATELDRVHILAKMQAAASAGALDEESRTSAVEAAHKLAGVLGTFGLPRGTDLARQAETAFRKGTAAGDDLRIAIEELARLIESANP